MRRIHLACIVTGVHLLRGVDAASFICAGEKEVFFNVLTLDMGLLGFLALF